MQVILHGWVSPYLEFHRQARQFVLTHQAELPTQVIVLPGKIVKQYYRSAQRELHWMHHIYDVRSLSKEGDMVRMIVWDDPSEMQLTLLLKEQNHKQPLKFPVLKFTTEYLPVTVSDYLNSPRGIHSDRMYPYYMESPQKSCDPSVPSPPPDPCAAPTCSTCA